MATSENAHATDAHESALIAAAYTLNVARDSAKKGRAGAANPISNIVLLSDCLRDNNMIRDVALGSGDQSDRARFLREMFKTQVQYLELSKNLAQLPKDHRGYAFDEEHSLRIRQGILTVMERLGAEFEIFPEPERLEMETILLLAKFHVSTWLEGSFLVTVLNDIKGIAENIIKRSESIDPRSDPHQFAPWCQFSALVVMIQCGLPISHESRDFLFQISPEDIEEDWIAWNIVLAQVQLSDSLVRRQKAIVSLNGVVPRYSDSLEKQLALRATGMHPVLAAAAELCEAGNLDIALSLLQANCLLQGIGKPFGLNAVFLFFVDGYVYSLICEDLSLELIRVQINQDTISSFMAASEAAEPEEVFAARKNLAKAVRPITERLAERADFLTMIPFGLVSWWPWQSFSSGSGQSLCDARDIDWIHPAGDPNVGTVSLDKWAASESLLVIDTSFNEASMIKRTWQEKIGRDARVLEFSSVNCGNGSPKALLEVMAKYRNCLYFGHASSDPLDPHAGGLSLDHGSVASISDIHKRNFTVIENLILIACEGGRDGVFVSGVSPAHAFAHSGVRCVVSTLWAIFAKDGGKYAVDILNELGNGRDLRSSWRHMGAKARPDRAPFFIMGR